MLGTLNGGLEARGIKLNGSDIRAEVEGTNELRDGNIILARIHVHYRLRIPAGSRDTVDRLLAKHQDKCPTAQSIKAAVQVDWSADIEES
ncbi:MAG: OsmC family protein [Longimicrobiales bacterium]